MELSSRSAGCYEMPENGTPAHMAVQIIEDDLERDIVPAYNLAGFATTYMENEAEQLMLKNIVS
jgi:glutamate decarboxylase